MKINRKDGIVYERKSKKINYDKKITFYIDDELKNKLDILKVNKSKFIRKAIENEINKLT